ncbi:MAG TPA: Maf family protein [Kouleothrix sp.]|uniref:Maf family protein n=1 Tax=Kouleothrix sp. TaxID=2779161 RepID=UPI002C62BD62|nr:Maf family protein [Kouleothrix sp.]HRC74962.1 Maf family protein [Kouleothrix sp.]
MNQTHDPPFERQGEPSGARLRFPPGPPDLVLASASPRRRELLGWLGASFRVLANNAEEDETPAPADLVAALPACPVPLATHPTLLAWRKADGACAEAPDSVIIGADTIVVLDGEVLGKPRDAAHARAMLRQLSGRTHTVYTGIALIQPGLADRGEKAREQQAARTRLQLDLVASRVDIAPLDEAEIEAYVATGEPMDKAGAYGIQGLGGRLVRAVGGSYTCVVGLPLPNLHRLLAAAGFSGLHDPADAYQRWIQAQGKEPLPCPPTFP